MKHSFGEKVSSIAMTWLALSPHSGDSVYLGFVKLTEDSELTVAMSQSLCRCLSVVVLTVQGGNLPLDQQLLG